MLIIVSIAYNLLIDIVAIENVKDNCLWSGIGVSGSVICSFWILSFETQFFLTLCSKLSVKKIPDSHH